MKSKAKQDKTMTKREVKETKVVYNVAPHSEFGLSDTACEWLAERGLLERYTAYLHPENYERVEADWRGENGEEPMEYSDWRSTNPEHWECCPYWEDHIPRHHPLLVQVVEEMGEKANSGERGAELRVAVVRGNRYRIGECDGIEAIETPRDMFWVKV